MGRDPGCEGAEGDVVGLGQAADDGQPLLLRPRRRRASRTPSSRSTGDAGQGARRGPRPFSASYTTRGADARLDRPLLRGRRRQGRLRHGLVGDAGAERRPRGARRRARHPARERPRHHLRRLGLLRPQRLGHGDRRRRADVAARRPPGPRAVDAPRRARLGPEGPGDRAPAARRPRREREHRRLGPRGVDPRVLRDDRDRQRPRRPHRADAVPPPLGGPDPLRHPREPAVRALPGRHRLRRERRRRPDLRLGALAGADAGDLRDGVLLRRAGGGRGRRPGRAAAARHEGQADGRRARDGGAGGEVADPPLPGPAAPAPPPASPAAAASRPRCAAAPTTPRSPRSR